jgi:proline utilization trans-activator
MYSGVSARMCNMLQLHETAAFRDLSAVERENRKRVWWSTFCIDRMASTQMGVLPTLQIDQGDLDYPTNDGLSSEDMAEFADPDYLTARIQLTIIQADAVKDHDSTDAGNEKNIATLVHPTLERLLVWKNGLPEHMAVPFHEKMAKIEANTALLRSLANLHLRYNHVCIASIDAKGDQNAELSY